MQDHSFINISFLKSVLSDKYRAYCETGKDDDIKEKLRIWSLRTDLGETSSETPFKTTFFRDMWGYQYSGTEDQQEFHLYDQYPVAGAGQRGGTGKADLAIGYFNHEYIADTPQILCEFKGAKTALDSLQNRVGNNRSPVKQALDYLNFARRGLYGNEAIQPTWAIATNMNEFRLYWFDRAPQHLEFIITPKDLLQGQGLLANTEEARFQRFLFATIFHKNYLLSKGGKSELEKLIGKQWVQQAELENKFYKEYKAFREKLYNVLVVNNENFEGTRGQLVRLTQKILDRCIFIFFCEDMGQTVNYPPQLLRDFLIHESRDGYFDANSDSIWRRLVQLFARMNTGGNFGGHDIQLFNGGLFADDPVLNSLYIPNDVFCTQGQGENEATLFSEKSTLLYLSSAYNYASEGLGAQSQEFATLGATTKNDVSKTLGLYTLGRIFEQSITELEILEAEADGLLSVNKESKRKRDGVFYTPEWVVQKIIHHTFAPRLQEIKIECGWPTKENSYPDRTAIEAYRERLKQIKILDPACGSGAFLITALHYLIHEWHNLRIIERESLEYDIQREKGITAARRGLKELATYRDDATLTNDILRNNIYGVDINPASVEISKLALWLHTATGKSPLSSLDNTIKDGNSLIGSEFYKGRLDLDKYDADQRERINAFDWETAFPDVFNAPQNGFDFVIGNPPYVKLQNFRKVHSDMAEFLKTRADNSPAYASTQTGNFDLYLPFIEKGISLLNDRGRMGYICPSVWIMNDYGAGLRQFLATGQNLTGWVDFKSHQIFAEATTYTALQYFSKQPNEKISVVNAPDGAVKDDPWEDTLPVKTTDLNHGNRWLLLAGEERKLINKLSKNCTRLDDPKNTKQIFVGVQTSSDKIYHLEKITDGRYRCSPGGKNDPSYEVDLEDALMHPLVSGPEAKRYRHPNTDTYILFPYEKQGEAMRLIPADKMARDYPNAWAYLRSYETNLRGRERGKMDKDAKWWGYVYPKNLDKQEIAKLFVAQTVPEMRVFCDHQGEFYLNNVRVNGISAINEKTLWYLLAVLNAPVADYVFKRIAKPKDNKFFEANKQFIAPLPIPKATKAQKENIGKQAEKLQQLHTKHHETKQKLTRRFEKAIPTKKQSYSWLFPELSAMTKAKELKDAALEKMAALDDFITPDSQFNIQFNDGELQLSINRRPFLTDIYLDDELGQLTAIQWSILLDKLSITDKTTANTICDKLLLRPETNNQALINQIIKLDHDLRALTAEITEAEKQINQDIYAVYKLSEDEIALIERG